MEDRNPPSDKKGMIEITGEGPVKKELEERAWFNSFAGNQ